MTATDAIIEFASADHALPKQVRADTVRLLADTLAGGAAGAQSAEARKVRAAIGAFGSDPEARLLCGGEVPAVSAAFFNGFAIHCLEWDAVHEGAVVHALSVVTAAVMAQSDDNGGMDPEYVLRALAVGVDIASGLGIAATGPMSFFRPATAGVIGAALAAARLTDIPPEKYADVMGLAYSSASGTMQAHVEASIALPLQIANAARAAITAVRLVECGLDGPHDALEGPFGYAKLFEPLDLSRYTSDLGKVWRISEVAIKPFPSGRASHGALGELEQLYREGVRLPDIAKVELFAPPLIERLVGRPYKADMTAAYARLCLPILAPLMLRDGIIDPALFDSDALHAAELVELTPNVCVTLDGNPDGNAMAPQRLVLTTKAGETIERTISANLGSIANPMSAEQSAAKYALCRKLAGSEIDQRIFDDPLSYFANSL
ncbi:MmgE/PrpD family protein [Erythrobacter sp. YT30]|uniref:MmgE/PrpD family protein n=1 Tax=Erythrobacter sp. YT30 TaxID=1735012 RepID=UPI00076DA5D2|nr:MmgE/PrpD family protein [Erythrobacter sp. YT30]KWV90777.1 MmgE/PrpD [Erythrobacter sp. YT30]